MNVYSVASRPSLSDLQLLNKADLIEIRIDLLGEIPSFVNRLQKPWIATLRDMDEGGKFNGSHSKKIRILRTALNRGARYVDLEAKFPHDRLPISKLLRSYHLTEDTASLRSKALRQLLHTPGSLLKCVIPTIEARPLFEIERQLVNTRPTIFIHANLSGQWTRLRPPGIPWNYISFNKTIQTGPGQLQINDAPLIERASSLYGITGWPISHSLSPKIHNTLFKKYLFSGVYTYFPSSSFKLFFDHFKSQLTGLSITSPHKIDAFKSADHNDTLAKQVGAINTLTKVNGKWHGTNTDAQALIEVLTSHPHAKNVTIIGSGGFARAALVAASQTNRSIQLVARNDFSKNLASEFKASFCSLNQYQPGSEHMIIQATSAELLNKRLPFSTRHCKEGTILVESLYNKETLFLAEASSGCYQISGKEIFARQAAKQFELWTKHQPNLNEIYKVIDS